MEGVEAAVLFRTDSLPDDHPGAHHLLEHLIVDYCETAFGPTRVFCLTTEDYVMVQGDAAGRLMEGVRQLRIDRDRLAWEKARVLQEIVETAEQAHERFFRAVWRGTRYERSPLGSLHGVASLDTHHLEELWRRMSAQETIWFGDALGVRYWNRRRRLGESGENSRHPEARRISVEGKQYLVLSYSGRVDEMQVLAAVLRSLNPERIVQVCEKLHSSVLIVECGAAWPEARALGKLWGTGVQLVLDEAREIAKSSADRAWNELESLCYYGVRWQERVTAAAESTPGGGSRGWQDCCAMMACKTFSALTQPCGAETRQEPAVAAGRPATGRSRQR